MASYTIAAGERAAHNKTLVASTVDTVTFSQDVGAIEVTNLSGSAAIYFTVDGSTPTVAGASTHLIPAAISSRTVAAAGGSAPAVKLISSGTPAYSVSGD